MAFIIKDVKGPRRCRAICMRGRIAAGHCDVTHYLTGCAASYCNVSDWLSLTSPSNNIKIYRGLSNLWNADTTTLSPDPFAPSGLGSCRISPPRFLAECGRSPLNQGSFVVLYFVLFNFYRATHFSAKRGIAIACHLSVRPSVTLVNCDHIGWNSSKIISPLVSLGRSLFATPTWRVCSKENTRNFRPNGGGMLKKRLSVYKSSNISETRQDRTKVTIEVE